MRPKRHHAKRRCQQADNPQLVCVERLYKPCRTHPFFRLAHWHHPQVAETGLRTNAARSGQIADLREVVLEVGRRTVGGDCIRVRVQLVEHETVRIALVLPEIVAQIARFGTARL